MEIIRINNFSGINNLSITLKKVNVFIGPQATGKSITAKLIYFFKSISEEFTKPSNYEKTLTSFKIKLLDEFKELFPEETWIGHFSIKYTNNNYFIKVEKKNLLKLGFSQNLNVLFQEIKKSDHQYKKSKLNNIFDDYDVQSFIMSEFNKQTKILNIKFNHNNFFIPAGRSFYSNMDAAFFSTLNTKNNLLDPFLKDFGSLYLQLKKYFNDYFLRRNPSLTKQFNVDLLYEILNSEYKNENEIDYLIHKDKRKIRLSTSSSGQQEGLPLLITLAGISILNFRNPEFFLYIEEPEAHLYPSSQKKIIEFIAYCTNFTKSIKQIIITTHSPYVLTTFNNLLLADKKYESVDQNGKIRIEAVLSRKFHVKSNEFSAYYFNDGTALNIIDNDTNLIDANSLDQISYIISEEFDNILDV